MEQVRREINTMVKILNRVATVLESDSQTPSASTQRGAANLPPISDTDGAIRDPAYILRSRAWDRIRKGYVVI